MQNRTIRNILTSLAGGLLALATFEAALRPIASRKTVSESGIVEQLYSHEGYAVSHTSADGQRLTGAPEIEGGQTWLILGDSFVAALQVPDQDTMGAVIERQARQAGIPLNVRAYGYAGEGIPHLLGVADQMLAKWDPARVVVVLNDEDLSWPGIAKGERWSMRIAPDLSTELVETPRVAEAPQPPSLRQNAMDFARRSTLLREVNAQYQLVLAGRSAPPRRTAPPRRNASRKPAMQSGIPDTAIPHAVVPALKAAFGPRLAIVFLPPIPPARAERRLASESALLDACRGLGVPCITMRDSLVADRDTNHRFAMGFFNSAPSDGHLNTVGHQIVGSEIFRLVFTQPDVPER